MENKKIIIIGGGITGLSAGCYLQMNNYDTEIFELHNIPGGLCTAWKRKGYTFDGCIHWLCGSRPGNELHTIWEDLGAIQGKNIINHEIFISTNLGNGTSFNVYSNSDRLKEEMLRHAPEDKDLINSLINAIKTCKNSNIPVLKAPELYTAIDGLKMVFTSIPLLKIINKWKKISILQLQQMFKNELLNKNFSTFVGMPEEMPVFALIYTLALFDDNSAGYPLGGSLEFATSIEKRYLSLGGKIQYNSAVKEIIVENHIAKGVVLKDGRKHYGDIIISAADGHYTIFDMLKGKYKDEEIDNRYKTMKPFSPIIQVSLGIAREFKDVPDAVTHNIIFDKPVYIDPKNSAKDIGLKIYNFDPTLAPIGKTVFTALITTDYQYWVDLKANNIEQYDKEKERIADEVTEELEKKFGGIKDALEVIDVATPATYTRYTNNWMGSFEGWIPTVDNFSKNMKKTLPNLSNFYMIGQWVQPGGGLPTGGMHGRYLAQILCKKDKKKFKTQSFI
jgi:phytoene dehydrogenase-like protein